MHQPFDGAHAAAGVSPRKSGGPHGTKIIRSHWLQYSSNMAPTVFRDGQFRFFFFSREESRIHVHVAHPDGEAKFWLTPSVQLAVNVGLSGTQVRQAQAVVEAHRQEIEDAWSRHFEG
jgi:Domain of unknown function (DUF4160)